MRRVGALLIAAAAALATTGCQEAEGRTAQPATPVGQAVFQHWCAPCHDRGLNHPGTLALDAKYQGRQPASLLDRRDLSPELVRYFVRNGVSVMPVFRKTEISDPELRALGEFLSQRSPRKSEGAQTRQ